MPKILKNLEVVESESKDAKAEVQAVVSSVTIAYVFTKYHVYLKPEQYESLLKCLRLPPDKEVCSKFKESVIEYDDKILK